MTRYLPHLRLPIISLIIIVATFGSAFSQTPTLSSAGELAPVVKLIRDGQRDEALKQLKNAVKADELNADAWYLLGIVYLQLHDFKKATSAFQSAIKLQPTLAASTHAQLGYSQALRNNLNIATQEAKKALEIDANNADALYAMAVVNIRSRARAEALNHIQTLIALRPDLAEAYLLKSMAFVGLTGDVAIVNEAQQQRVLRYEAAAEALDQYLRLATDQDAARPWEQQLNSLKFYTLAEQPGSTEVYSTRNVTERARVIEKPEPTYTETARAALVSGTVVLRCVVGVDGTVQHVLVVQSLTHGLTEASIAAARKIKFAPATLNGRPVPVFMQLEYNFNFF